VTMLVVLVTALHLLTCRARGFDKIRHRLRTGRRPNRVITSTSTDGRSDRCTGGCAPAPACARS
jgi:hypothetical protein